MGRKSTRDSVLDREYAVLKASGVNHDQAFDLAWEKGTQAIEDKKAHRRKQNAHYQYMHRWKKQYNEKIRLENESKEVKPTTYLLNNEEVAIIEAYRNKDASLIIAKINNDTGESWEKYLKEYYGTNNDMIDFLIDKFLREKIEMDEEMRKIKQRTAYLMDQLKDITLNSVKNGTNKDTVFNETKESMMKIFKYPEEMASWYAILMIKEVDELLIQNR